MYGVSGVQCIYISAALPMTTYVRRELEQEQIHFQWNITLRYGQKRQGNTAEMYRVLCTTESINSANSKERRIVPPCNYK